MGVATPHYLRKYKEVEGIITLTWLYLEASKNRKESRGAHYRTDYPQRNNKDFLGWVCQKQAADTGPTKYFNISSVCF